MTTVETTETRDRLFVDQNNTRAHLVLANTELDYNERMALVNTLRGQLNLASDELDCMFSTSAANMLALVSKTGLAPETWLRVADEISNQFNRQVHLITEDDAVALMMLQATDKLGEMLNTMQQELIRRAVQAMSSQW